MPSVDGGGVSVSYRETGDGDPVVFLHTGPGSAADWRPVFDLFPVGRRLIAMNGFGRGGTSPWPAGDIRIEDVAGLVRRLASTLEEPFHLVGHSYGGAVALHVASTQPGDVRSLALIEPQVYPLLGDRDPDLLAQTRAVLHEFESRLAGGQPEAAWRGFIDHYGHPGSWDRLPESARASIRAIGDTAVRSWRALMTNPITAGDLHGIDLPVLIIEGSASTEPERRMCRILAEGIPGARHAVVEGAGHMAPLTHPAEIVELLTDHLLRADMAEP